MKLILLADIFGKTDALDELAEAFDKTYKSVALIDPYEGQCSFTVENEAYDFFQKSVGLLKYSQIVEEVLEEESGAYHAVGFSVGGSALWLAADKMVFHPDSRLSAFYSSQIRNYLQLTPKTQFDLYFPRSEEHFEVNEIIAGLARIERVKCYKTAYYHGFMNRKSKNYNEEGCREYLNLLSNSQSYQERVL